MQVIENKHTSRSWIAKENEVKTYVTGDKKILIPNKDYYSFSSTQGFSVSFTMSPGSGGSASVPLSKRPTAAAVPSWDFYWNGGILYFELFNTVGGSTYASVSLTNNANKKYHVTAVYDNATNKVSLYINGILVNVSTGTLTGNFVSTNSLCIGGLSGTTANDFDGSISNLILFNKALTASEVSSLMHEVGVAPSNLHAYTTGHFPANQRFGKVLYDTVEQYNYMKPPVGDQKRSDIHTQSGNMSLELGWSADGTNFISAGANAGKIVYNYYTYNYFRNYQIGLRYKVTVEVSEWVSGAVTIYIGGTNFGIVAGNGVGSVTGAPTNVFYSDRGDVWFQSNSNGGTNGFQGKVKILSIECLDGQLTNNHGELINYTNAETGITDPGSSTAWPNFYDKAERPTLSRKFVDNTDRITTTIDHLSLVSSSFTVEFVANKINAVTSADLAFVFGTHYTNNAAPHIKFGDGKLIFDWWNNALEVLFAYANKPIQFSFVYDVTTLTRHIYADGFLLGSKTDTDATKLVLGTTNPIQVGGWDINTSEFFDGYMNNFRIWSTARTQSQIIDTKHKLIGKATTGLFLEWAMGETVNGTVKDFAGTRTGTRAGNSTDVREWKTGMPEIKGALKVMENHYGSFSPVPAALGSMATGDFSVIADFHVGAANAAVVTLFTASNSTVWNELHLRISGLDLLYLTNQSGAGNVPSTSTKMEAGWHQAGFIRKSGSLQLWLDGRLLYSRADTFSYAGLNNMYCGNGGTGINDVHIANIRLYNRSAYGIKELKNLYNNSLFKSIAIKRGLLASINFNKILTIGATNYFEDGSGNAYHPAVTGYTAAETTSSDPAYAIVPTFDIWMKDAPATDLILDLDARVSITLASGKISQWKSKVGSYIAYENDIARQAAWVISNGSPGVSFGLSNSLVIDNFDLSSISEVGILIFGKLNNVGNTAKVFLEHGPDTNSTVGGILVAHELRVGGSNPIFYSYENVTNGGVFSNTAILTTDPFVFGLKLTRITNGSINIDVGATRTGYTRTATSPTTYLNAALNIGNRAGASIGMDGIINRILIYKSHAAYEQARRYLGLKHKSVI